MLKLAPQFAQASDPATGIGAFNINLKAFIFQLITFVIVLLVFKRWVLPPLLKTLEDRRQTLEKSLVQAQETQEALARAEVKAEEILARARKEANDAFQAGKKEAEAKRTEMLEQTRSEVGLLIENGKKNLEAEKVKIVEEARNEIVSLAMLSAEKLLESKDLGSGAGVKELHTLK